MINNFWIEQTYMMYTYTFLMPSACDQVGVKFRKTHPTIIIRVLLLENIYDLSKNVYNSTVRFNIRFSS